MKVQGNTIYHNFAIKSTPKQIFKAFTDPEHLIKWWPQKCSGEAKLGSIYKLFFTEEYDWTAEVVRNEPYKSFYFRMLKSDDDWAPTTFGIDLKERDMDTYVKFS